jgi:FKBP-type peptidyl-prolyl cis-trans isomerase
MRNSILLAFGAGSALASAFQTQSTSLRPPSSARLQALNADLTSGITSDRRSAVKNMASALLTASSLMVSAPPTAAAKSDPETKTGAYDTSNRAPDFVQKYEDFQLTDEGWSYKDVKPGTGDVKIEDGDRVVFDWSGYTIGYFGRPFEAKGGPQGGAFDKDLDYQRTVVGSGNVVKGVECALRSMKPGGVRQVVVPYGPLSYPPDDLEHNRVGPKPTTFSGQRALNFVLENPRVDRTLLFNVKVIRVDKKDGKGGFKRG